MAVQVQRFERINERRDRDLDLAAEYLRKSMHLRCQASVILRPQLSSHIDGCGEIFWMAEYGELIATGDTPAEAFGEFDRIWIEGDV